MRAAYSPDVVAVIAPTWFEYAALKLLLPRSRIVYAGIGLSRRSIASGSLIVSGLAGGLAPDCEPGAVVIPRQVGTEEGAVRVCDPDLVSVLTDAAHSLGFRPRHDALLTASELVTGSRRRHWADRGYVAADMETAFLPVEITHFATIRVILDTPGHSISTDWTAGGRAVLGRPLRGELIWLATHAPRFALRAAQITRAALARLDSGDGLPSMAHR